MFQPTTAIFPGLCAYINQWHPALFFPTTHTDSTCSCVPPQILQLHFLLVACLSGRHPLAQPTSLQLHQPCLHLTMANSLLDSPPQFPAAGPWGSLFAVQEPGKPRRVSVALPFAPKKMPAYRYGMKRNLEMCTEALGCETGGVDPAADDADEGVERKRKYREEEEEIKVERTERRARVLPPPLTTLAAGATRMRMVHERRGGRLEVYAVRASGMEAERSGGRLRLRLLPCAGCNAAAACSSQQEPQEAEEDETEEVDQQRQEECVVPKYVRRERCLKVESGATAARCSIKWEQEQTAAFWVATT
ncbi:hypothetical protein VPH35_009138 [Triticum aestivum]